MVIDVGFVVFYGVVGWGGFLKCEMRDSEKIQARRRAARRMSSDQSLAT